MDYNDLEIEAVRLKLFYQSKVANQKVLMDDIRRLCIHGMRDGQDVANLYQQLFAFEAAYQRARREFDRAVFDYLISMEVE